MRSKKILEEKEEEGLAAIKRTETLRIYVITHTHIRV